MRPPERFRRRVFPHWEAPADGWQSIAHHEAGHVVAAQCYGVTPHRAVIDLRNGSGGVWLASPPVDPPTHDEESAALGVFGIVGLADASIVFEEIALRSAVILMAGQQAEFIQAGITPAGVARMNAQDTRQATYLLRFIFGTDVALGWVQLQARYLLRQHWQRVEKIAGELKERGMYAG